MTFPYAYKDMGKHTSSYSDTRLAPLKTDENGRYLECFNCDRHVYEEELPLIKKFQTKSVSEIFPSEETFSPEYVTSFKNGIAKSIESFKSYLDRILDGELSSSAFTYSLQKEFNLLLENNLNWLPAIHRQFIDQLPNFAQLFYKLRDAFDSRFYDKLQPYFPNMYGTARELISDESKQKIKEAYLSRINEEVIPTANELANLMSNIVDRPRHVEVTIAEKFPLCPQCYDELAMTCAEDGCEFTSINEDDFIEVNKKKWDPETRKTERETYLFCKEHGAPCSHCGDGLQKSDEESVEHGREWFHRDCFYEVYSHCDDCGEIFYRDDLHYSENGDGEYCNNCFPENDKEEGIEDSPEFEGAQELVDEINQSIGRMYPLDKQIIVGNILPVLNLAAQKFGATWSTKGTGSENPNEAKIIDWVSKRIQKDDARSAVISEIEINGIAGAIETFKKNIAHHEHMKEQYPNLKGYKPIPVNIAIEEAQGSHGGMVFALYPSTEMMDWAEKTMPGSKDFYEDHLSRKGHHSGALAYARMSLSGGNIIIDNLQTDLDTQSLVWFINNEIDKKKNQVNDLKIEFETVDNKEETAEAINDIEKDIKRLEKNKAYAIWWSKAIEKFWAPYMLNLIKQFANERGLKAYLTSFDMQKQKWRRIPDRNVDVYEKIPEMMGMGKENVLARPEDLSEKRWEMRRVASELYEFCSTSSEQFYKIASSDIVKKLNK